MFQTAHPLFLTCETPLHAGSGDSLGIVDLPIQRERHTSFPKIEASSLKGALREAFEQKVDRKDHVLLLKAFGPDEMGSEAGYAGALGFTDARLLLFPVKSMKGVFAWITCPKSLRQFSSDLKLCSEVFLSDFLDVEDGKAMPLSSTDNLAFGEHYVLEEYTFEKSNPENHAIKFGQDLLAYWLADKLFEQGSYWHKKAKNDILILSDNDFKDFVNLSTEVITRIEIKNSTGTVSGSALFTEEYLPSESVLYSLVLASPEFLTEKERKDGKNRPDNAQTIIDFFDNNLSQIIQLGGNATLGKGLLKTKFLNNTETR